MFITPSVEILIYYDEKIEIPSNQHFQEKLYYYYKMD